MPADAFFELKTPTRTSYAEVRYSRICLGYVVRVDDKKPELILGVEADHEVGQRIEAWKTKGFKPIKKANLPEILTPAMITKITGLPVPVSYARFLDTGKHRKLKSKTVLYDGRVPAAGTISGVPGFADNVPIVFDDPAIPFWLSAFGWTKSAPTAIPIALFEEGRALLIDSKTANIFGYDNSATKPLVPVANTLEAMLKLVKS